MEIKIVNTSSKDQWNKFVDEHGSIFHLWQWRNIYVDSYGYKPLYLAAYENNSIIGILPLFITGKIGVKRIVSVPYVDYAGPCSINDNISKQLMEYAVGYCTLNHFDKMEVFSSSALKESNKYHITDPFCRFVMPINNNYEYILSKVIHQKTRNMVNKSEKSGISTENTKNSSILKEYYSLYIRTMQKLGQLPHSYNYFMNAFKYLNEYTDIFVSRYNKKIMAGLIIFNYKENMYIWNNASNEKYKNLAANNAVYASAIKFACNNKIKLIDFGSTIPETSHYFFKKRWGGNEEKIYLVSNSKYDKMQKSILRVMLNIYCKYIPGFILAKTSELLYRYY